MHYVQLLKRKGETMAVMRNRYTAKWNRRVNHGILPSRVTMNVMVKDMVNSRLEFKPSEYIVHRKIDFDLLSV